MAEAQRQQENAFNRATQAFSKGRLSEAEAQLRQIIGADPNFHPAYFQLGLIAEQVGKRDLAIDLLAHACRLDPDSGQYHWVVGELLRRAGRLDEAVTAGERAIKLSPDVADAFYNLGLIRSDRGETEAAEYCYRRAIGIDAKHTTAANNLGSLLENRGDIEGAYAAYRQAVEADSKNAEAQNNLGALLSADGDLEEARKRFKAAIRAKPHFVHAHYNLSSLKTYKEDDGHLKSLHDLQAVSNQLAPEERHRLYFALGKALEDIGNHDEAFDAYQAGNQMKRDSFQYDDKESKRSVSLIKSYFTKSCFQDTATEIEDDTPIFVLGMPRSGTTLVEQILASHAKVFGAGELDDLSNILEAGPEQGGVFLSKLENLEVFDWKALGSAYIQALRSYSSDAPHVTDKMPANFFLIGAIHQMLPNAKIVHVKRDPMDTCFSNYTRLFNATMLFAYDLKELGRYYCSYEQLMAHWAEVLPEGRIHHVQYEDLVAQTETHVRALLEYCRLEWDDACLRFYENKRNVKTASIAQVRRPIYKASVARWKRFEAHLEPLRKEIYGS